ncbi:ChbG/HpnK family deacetylase [Novosphingobium sp. KCTC 2891]|uniref:ChbG/HpnK family deacetylase n=1 Tax=Novosphingobium sp. KCTC 2891 TaxID=2989730 RepID=UPI0022221DEA|nr:ChbG/HpnK family deacetylase [Novosphingobium sp. KCTC 2891]MCW1381885.1 ChbG/HpnK family deacetylase [Novosphingobium sp. KCTC 2891]
MHSYTLCADDFALSRPISETIAELALAGCINAISCMAALPGWIDDAALLAPLMGARAGVQMGLHLVLSGERPLTDMAIRGPDGRLPSADQMMVLAYLGRLDPRELAREIDAQFTAFRHMTGRRPDFVDAHQHVHVHPQLRRLVIAATQVHAPRAWVRNPADRPGSMMRRPFAGKAFGSSLHALGMKDRLARAGLSSNDSFAGHYDFRADYADLLPRFFTAAGRGHLVMCHPGAGHLEGDTIAAARIAEAAVLRTLPLRDRLEAYGLREIT